MMHFVGFRKDQELYNRAVRVFGFPDFIHYHFDHRVFGGGEYQEGDTVVFANGSENRCHEHSYNDSENQ